MFVGILASDGRRSATRPRQCLEAGPRRLYVCVCVWARTLYTRIVWVVRVCVYSSSLIIRMSSIHHAPRGWRQIRNRYDIPPTLRSALTRGRPPSLPYPRRTLTRSRKPPASAGGRGRAAPSSKKQILSPSFFFFLRIYVRTRFVRACRCTSCQLERKHIVCNRYY